MCIQNMWLMATRLGLAATNYSLGHPGTDERLREAFGVPDHFALPTMLVLGYPRHSQPPRPRRPLAAMVHHERFAPDRVRSDEELVDALYAQGIRGRGFR
jgi:nitroreductase